MVMRWTLLAFLAITVVGCSGARDLEWMKPGQSYTQEEFRRDVAACTKDRVLQETCMEARGWVTVSPAKGDPKGPRPTEPEPRRGRY